MQCPYIRNSSILLLFSLPEFLQITSMTLSQVYACNIATSSVGCFCHKMLEGSKNSKHDNLCGFEHLSEEPFIIALVSNYSCKQSINILSKKIHQALKRASTKLTFSPLSPEHVVRTKLLRSQLSSIEILNLDNVQCISDELLQQILNYQPQLRDVSVRYCFEIKDERWILNSSHNCKVDFSGCWRLMEPGMSLIPEAVLETQILALKTSKNYNEGLSKACTFLVPDSQATSGSEQGVSASILYCFRLCRSCETFHYLKVQNSLCSITFLVVLKSQGQSQTSEHFLLWNVTRRLQPEEENPIWLTSTVHNIHPSLAKAYMKLPSHDKKS
mmetsp:Transcript_2865/g.3720  ORF Transcript_2865/g.3720 Transcript_2865/m.3720 type:complete len:329 (+) Transcript_2865:1-987(+)